ncbi:hypothetical protein FHR24_001622 [Wenyingzhuangia heitensis]|uniref:DUF4209 domain-containing protein n=1 Tax=Wenyingzhuangia heitensis TaxID=1487859 RepID=A0ABX0UA97_9FLAO|nr:hypothetical protein [Wenyingzhuangia heitensis]NIJ45183.1 hypothetical protein [Wenyingzhuangia heitensis]
MEINRVVYYSNDDSLSEDNLLLAEKKLNNYGDNTEIKGVIDILEFYCITLYFDNEIYLKSWSTEKIKKLNRIVSNLKKDITRFCIEVNNDNVTIFINQLEFDYKSIFISLLSKYAIYKRLSKSVFIEILKTENVCINILEYKNIVEHFEKEIKNHLISHKETTELLLSEYEENKLRNTPKLYVPKSLSIHDKNEIISKYLDNPAPNTNYLNLIINSKKSNQLYITDEIRYKAKKIFKKINDDFFENKKGYTSNTRFQVCISLDQEEPVIKKEVNGLYEYIYSSKFFNKQRKDYTRLYNFITPFNYTDFHKRITLTQRDHELNSMDFLGLKSKHTYSSDNFAFVKKEYISNLQIRAYDNYLKNSINSNIELIITSFINDNLINNLGLNNLEFKFSSPDTSYLEKNRMLAPEIEHLLRQYNSYVKTNTIDQDFLKFSSVPVKIENILSLKSKKYIYLNKNNNEVKKIQHYFFSKISSLIYINSFNRKYKNFYGLLYYEKVNYELYTDYRKKDIDKLIQEGYLSLDSENNILFGNYSIIYTIGQLYYNEVICFEHYSETTQNEFLDLEKKQIIRFGNSLLSEEEIKYFNYYLNKSMFTNGLDLRNKYVHGTNGDSELQHESNYYKLLKLLILLLIKIEDDLLIYLYQE